MLHIMLHILNVVWTAVVLLALEPEARRECVAYAREIFERGGGR